MVIPTAFPRSHWIVALAALLVDEASKAAARWTLPLCGGLGCPKTSVLGPFGFVRVENAGSALGFLQWMWFWTLVATIGIGAVPLLVRRSSDRPMLLSARSARWRRARQPSRPAP